MNQANKKPSDADYDDDFMNNHREQVNEDSTSKSKNMLHLKNHQDQNQQGENRNDNKDMKLNQVEKSNIRQVVGGAMNQVADVINDNLIPFRYGTMASIFLLSVYGVSKTPIFFRYRNLSEIPSSFFTMRKTVHGRIVHIVKKEKNGMDSEKPITCLIHLVSPMSRILNRSLFEIYLKNNPSSIRMLGRSLEDSKDLLKIEIAGIQSPPPFIAPPGAEQRGEWLRRIAENRTPVACTLLSRKIVNKHSDTSLESGTLNIASTVSNKMNYNDQMKEEVVAVGKLAFRTGRFSLFRQDLGSFMVSSGRAAVAEGIYNEQESISNVDCSTSVTDLKSDANYMESLGIMEYDALKNSRGMWSYSSVRESRQDLIEEANFEANASIWRKLWRRLFQE